MKNLFHKIKENHKITPYGQIAKNLAENLSLPFVNIVYSIIFRSYPEKLGFSDPKKYKEFKKIWDEYHPQHPLPKL